MQDFDDCTYCGGRVSERKVKKVCLWGDELTAVVDNVPAGVCEQCGEKFYKANVLKIVEKILKERSSLVSQIRIPVADFARAGV